VATTTPDQDRTCEGLIAIHDSLAVTPPVMEGHPIRVAAFDGPRRTWEYAIRADGSLIGQTKIEVSR
jgi:hypothetical protein